MRELGDGEPSLEAHADLLEDLNGGVVGGGGPPPPEDGRATSMADIQDEEDTSLLQTRFEIGAICD